MLQFHVSTCLNPHYEKFNNTTPFLGIATREEPPRSTLRPKNYTFPVKAQTPSFKTSTFTASLLLMKHHFTPSLQIKNPTYKPNCNNQPHTPPLSCQHTAPRTAYHNTLYCTSACTRNSNVGHTGDSSLARPVHGSSSHTLPH